MLFGLLNNLIFLGAGTDPLVLLAEAFGHGAVATIAQNLVMDLSLASGSKSGDAYFSSSLAKRVSVGLWFWTAQGSTAPKRSRGT
jgi:hypothetical protein